MMPGMIALATRLLRFCQIPKIARAILSATLLGCVFGGGLSVVSLPAAAFEPPQSATQATATIALADLPRQGQRTYRLILQGGPFPHEKDGVVFGNYERQLPLARRGYYHEYTVKTPGARNRGARRIVCGGYQRTAPDACYYTSNHYSSFEKIVE